MKTKSSKSDSAWEKLKSLLLRRAHTEKELKQKLKAFDPEELQKALDRAEKNQWIEPPKDMAIRVANTLHRKKKGWLYIKSTLKKRGLPLIPKNPEIEKEKALYWLAKIRGSDRQAISKKTEQKLYRFLSYRGFETSDIKEALRDFLNS